MGQQATAGTVCNVYGLLFNYTWSSFIFIFIIVNFIWYACVLLDLIQDGELCCVVNELFFITGLFVPAACCCCCCFSFLSSVSYFHEDHSPSVSGGGKALTCRLLDNGVQDEPRVHGEWVWLYGEWVWLCLVSGCG